MDPMMEHRISCPNPVCPQPHDVQKVNVLVLQGSGQGTVTHPLRSSHITGQTELSKMLAAPAPPKHPWDEGGASYALLFLLPVCFLIGAFSLILFISAEAIAIVDAQGQAAPLLEFVQVILVTFGITLFFGLSSYFALIGPRRLYRRRYAAWVKAKAIWEELYYCHHCDTVFNPADRLWMAVPASHMKERLSDASKSGSA
jgi:hypothetical protein